MKLVQFNPFYEHVDFSREIDSLLPRSHFRFPRRRNVWPSTDFFENADSFLIKVDLPGINKDDVKIESDTDFMEISVKFAEEKTESSEDKGDSETEKPKFFLRERRSGEFTRRINFPTVVTPSESKITFENGVLSIEVPKAEEAKRVRLAID